MIAHARRHSHQLQTNARIPNEVLDMPDPKQQCSGKPSLKLVHTDCILLSIRTLLSLHMC